MPVAIPSIHPARWRRLAPRQPLLTSLHGYSRRLRRSPRLLHRHCRPIHTNLNRSHPAVIAGATSCSFYSPFLSSLVLPTPRSPAFLDLALASRPPPHPSSFMVSG